MWKGRTLVYDASCITCEKRMCKDEYVYMLKYNKQWLFKCFDCY